VEPGAPDAREAFRLNIETMELPTGLLRAPEQDHPIASPWPCRFGWRWIVSILERIRDQEPATARLVSLNRARRGAYNDIDSVNISGGLWLAGMSVSTARSLTCLLCLGNPSCIFTRRQIFSIVFR
jgi:hypothetical protein